MKAFRCALSIIALVVSPALMAGGADKPVPAAQVETQLALRDLLADHVFWVRDVVTHQLANDAKGAKAAEEQVVANAKALGAAIEPFYGKKAGEQFFTLLAGHYGAVKDYLTATVAERATDQEAAVGRLTDNAGQIADFLSGANPHLPRDTVLALFTAHGTHHVQQIRQLKAKQYAEEAKTWSAMKSHVYTIADALTGALAKQFPQKFQPTS